MTSATHYEYLADSAVSSFLSDKVPLNTSILKIAQDNDLNPEQIKRVVELANTKTFLKMFKDPGKKEENVEFDVADAGDVTKKFYGKDEAPGHHGGSVSITQVTITKHASSDHYEFESDFPDAMYATRHKFDEPPIEIEKIAELKPDRGVLEFRMRKIAENFKDKIYAEELDYQDKLVKVAIELKKDYIHDYATFEKEALRTYGQEITPVLEDLRTALCWKKPMGDMDKTASAFVVNDSPEMTTLGEMYQHKLAQVQHLKAAQLTKEKLKALRA